MSTLIVLWCLYNEKGCAQVKRFVGFSVKLSKQSIITVTSQPNVYWKHMGMIFQRCFLPDQLMKQDNMNMNQSTLGLELHKHVLKPFCLCLSI